MGKELEKATDIKVNPEEKVQEEAKAAQASQPVQPVFQQPVYQPGYQPGFVPAPQFAMQSNTQPSKPKTTRGTAAKVIALALCCSLVGGAVGAGTVICLNAYGIGVRPGYKIARMLNGDTGRRMRNNNNQERSAKSDDNRDSFRNRGGKNGGQRKGTGRDVQYKDKNNVQRGDRDYFGRNRRSQGESNIKGKDQGANTPDKGSDPAGQTTPETQQTTPSAGGEAKT